MGVRPRPRLRAAGVLLALVLSAIPAAAVPAAPPEPGARARAAVDELVVSVVDGEARPEPLRSAQQALLAVRDHRDMADWLGSIAEAVQLSTALEAVGAVSPARDLEGDDGEELGDVAVAGAVASAGAAGDLDGDGLEDVVVADYDLETGEARLRAVRGVDGSVLWVQAFAGDGLLAFPSGVDLDGDGAPELVHLGLRSDGGRYERTEEGTATDSRVVETYRVTYTWTFSVVAGGDGGHLWSRAIDGHLEERYEVREGLTEREERYTLEAIDRDVMPMLLSDGRVALQRISRSVDDRYGRSGIPWVAQEAEVELRFRGTTVLDVLDGATGAARNELVEGPMAGLAFLSPLGSAGQADAVLVDRWLVGDEEHRCSTTVLLSECAAATGDVGHELAVVDAATLEVRWAHRDPERVWFASVLDGDLTGDGLPDLSTIGWGDDEAPYVTTLLDSGDGRTLWKVAEPDSWSQPFVVADADGDGEGDLMTFALEHVEGAVVLRIDRRDGADGTALHSTRYEVPDDTDEPPPSGPLPVDPLAPLADVTGDGIPELERRVEPEGRFGPGTQEVFSLVTSTALWTVAEGYIVDGGEQDGLPGGELLQVVTDWGDESDEDHEPSTTVSSLVGATGAVRWSHTSQGAGPES